MEGIEMQAGSALMERLEAAAVMLEKSLGWLEERQRFLSGEVEKISATVETTRRERGAGGEAGGGGTGVGGGSCCGCDGAGCGGIS